MHQFLCCFLMAAASYFVLTPCAQEVEDYRLSNGLAAFNMLAEISQADASATR